MNNIAEAAKYINSVSSRHASKQVYAEMSTCIPGKSIHKAQHAVKQYSTS
jgi:hypothetical protein